MVKSCLHLLRVALVAYVGSLWLGLSMTANAAEGIQVITITARGSQDQLKRLCDFVTYELKTKRGIVYSDPCPGLVNDNAPIFAFERSQMVTSTGENTVIANDVYSVFNSAVAREALVSKSGNQAMLTGEDSISYSVAAPSAFCVWYICPSGILMLVPKPPCGKCPY